DRGCTVAVGRVKTAPPADPAQRPVPSMPDSTESLDRARAPKPMPKPGIMDIHAYVPGKASADGVSDPVKLSANENILGSSPKAREAYLSAAGDLQMYPDSRTTL